MADNNVMDGMPLKGSLKIVKMVRICFICNIHMCYMYLTTFVLRQERSHMLTWKELFFPQ